MKIKKLTTNKTNRVDIFDPIKSLLKSKIVKILKIYLKYKIKNLEKQNLKCRT